MLGVGGDARVGRHLRDLGGDRLALGVGPVEHGDDVDVGVVRRREFDPVLGRPARSVAPVGRDQ
jgi:hypothetical protein